MKKCSVLILATLALAQVAHSEEATVAVAANFAAPMEELATAFSASSNHQLQVSTGSTGKLYAQISNGAPFDLFLAADQKTPQKLIDDGLAVATSRITYASGTLVLWSADATLISDGESVLRANRFTRLAIASPELAPYGQAAVATLKALSVYDAIAPKLVTGENIAQAYQFVASGNAPLGFVAYSQVLKQGQLTSGSVWVVPAALYPPLAQDAVLLQRGATNKAAVDFLAYLQTDAAKAVMSSYGYHANGN